MGSTRGSSVLSAVLLAVLLTVVQGQSATLTLDMQIFGSAVLPFTSDKQSIITQGVATFLNSGVTASQIVLTVENTIAGTSTAGRRHLMAVGNGEPGVEVSMAIPTTTALASSQSTAISNAVTTGALSTQWGKLGESPLA
ncbi:MAG: hypothetical protein FRX49_03404 [Trebouxia sp. A1-2]|nr:MAG: hypothetical protein FRX49_03404 [Trebouxia sp. A1-2]